MQRRVHAHVPIPPVPVDRSVHLGAGGIGISMKCGLAMLSPPVRTGDSNLVVKMDVDAAIASAFFLDLADSHLTDFAR